MLTGLKNLLNSEKAIVCLALIAAATVLTGTGSMTIDQWVTYTKWLAVIYVAGKTVQGAVDSMSDAKIQAAEHEASGASNAMDVLSDLVDKFKGTTASADLVAAMETGSAETSAAGSTTVPLPKIPPPPPMPEPGL